MGAVAVIAARLNPLMDLFTRSRRGQDACEFRPTQLQEGLINNQSLCSEDGRQRRIGTRWDQRNKSEPAVLICQVLCPLCADRYQIRMSGNQEVLGGGISPPTMPSLLSFGFPGPPTNSDVDLQYFRVEISQRYRCEDGLVKSIIGRWRWF